MTTTNDWLQQGIAAARAGQRAQARQLLARAIQADQYNEDAWVWLAGVVDDPAHARQCLQQALRINPLNPQARQGIAWLDQKVRQTSNTASPAGAPAGGQRSLSLSSSDKAHAVTVQAVSQTQQASSGAGQGLFRLPPATNSAAPASQPHPSAQPASTSGFRLPGNPAPAQGKTSAEKPARRFSLFGKPKLADGATASDAAAAEAAPKPARRFSLFGKSKPGADAAAPGNASAAEAAPKPARRFSLFGKPNPVAAPMAAAAATAAIAGAAGATMPVSAAPAATPVAKPHHKEKVLPPEEGDPTRDCCPYCGELNKPDRRWCRRCNRSLMIRGPARETRSPWLSILSILWILGGVLGILGAIAALIGALALYSSIAGDLSGFPLILVVIAVIIALIYGGQIAIARAMMNRARWAYWIIAVLTALQLGGSLLGALGAAAMIREALTQAQAFLPSPEAAAAATAITGVFGTFVLIDVGIKAFFMLLVGLSWRDFYGPKERFVSEVRGNTDYELFNTGLALQRKGMWWMAMKQWEAAVANSPRDVDYLHALSVAYAKLGQWDQARETIARAIRIAPDSQALKQVQERIERMSAAQGGS
ncbi:MAG: tetratricopeptide repeat protein [Roseiflexaceae bacterium]|nr:tetratricopeptide repeat protein [Roseiflexaceae bacterium]